MHFYLKNTTLIDFIFKLCKINSIMQKLVLIIDTVNIVLTCDWILNKLSWKQISKFVVEV